MTPAEKRVKELIDRWLTSLDLHLQYVDLKDSAYNNVQPWPVHDRPTRWVLEHARQKVLELQAAFEARLAMGDSKFAESVENIIFLANLVGLQHVQRFIPLADPEKHGIGTLTELDGLKPVKPPASSAPFTSSGTSPAPTSPVAASPISPPSAPAVKAAPSAAPQSAKPAEIRAPDSTAVMPRVNVPPASPPPTRSPAPTSTAKAVDTDATREMPRPVRSPTAASAPAIPVLTSVEAKAPAAVAPSEPISDMHNLIIADAVRLLSWGKSWHELADLIVRIADRPKLPEIRKILRTHRATIEMRVAEGAEEEPKPKDGKKDKNKAKQR